MLYLCILTFANEQLKFASLAHCNLSTIDLPKTKITTFVMLLTAVLEVSPLPLYRWVGPSRRDCLLQVSIAATDRCLEVPALACSSDNL